MEERLPPEFLAVIVHLGQVCEGCTEGLRVPLRALREGLLPTDLKGISEIDLQRAQAQVAASADGELDGESAALAARQLEAADAIKAWGLAEAWCQASLEAARHRPESALPWATLAVQAAGRAALPCLPDHCSRELEMLAQAHRGNALRVLDEFHGAGQAFHEANESWRASDSQLFGDMRARTLSLVASLAIDQRRFDDALEDLSEAAEWARGWLSKPVSFGPTLEIKRAHALAQLGRTREAVQLWGEVARTLRPTQETRLWLIAQKNQLFYLPDLGQFDRVRSLLPEVRSVAESHGTEADRIRVRWVEGRLALGTGEIARAEELLTSVRQSFLDLNQGYSAAVASLELATVYCQQGKLRQLRRLAMELVPIFQSKDIHREALAALALFQQAALAEEVTGHFLEELVSYFRRAEGHPQLRFRKT
ncbi:MAG: hypothetical protein K0U98_11970 [Deltaproteobacteria bacterium]|nr:hypothetical protein [Deltaproteobacteria bacterium]